MTKPADLRLFAQNHLFIGLASRQTLGNINSGIFICMYKPFRIGEYVELNMDKAIVDIQKLVAAHPDYCENDKVGIQMAGQTTSVIVERTDPVPEAHKN